MSCSVVSPLPSLVVSCRRPIHAGPSLKQAMWSPCMCADSLSLLLSLAPSVHGLGGLLVGGSCVQFKHILATPSALFSQPIPHSTIQPLPPHCVNAYVGSPSARPGQMTRWPLASLSILCIRMCMSLVSCAPSSHIHAFASIEHCMVGHMRNCMSPPHAALSVGLHLN